VDDETEKSRSRLSSLRCVVCRVRVSHNGVHTIIIIILLSLLLL